MPTSTPPAPPSSCSTLPASAWLRLLCLGFVLCALSTGCRALRCGGVSDESINAARLLSLQGRDAQLKGHWDQAEEFYAAAVARCPSDERARCGYAEALWRRDARLDAVKHMEEGVRLSGDDPERVVQLGKMYLERGELHRAAVQAEKAIAANRQLASAWALRGDVMKEEGSRHEALASYYRALSFQPHYPDVELAVADIHSQEDHPQRALVTLQALAGRYPSGQVPAGIHFREGLVLRRLGRNRDAADSLAMAARQPSPTAEILAELARTQLLCGDAASARLTVNSMLEHYPAHVLTQALDRELGSRQGQMASFEAPIRR